jgi:hypothetical protein
VNNFAIKDWMVVHVFKKESQNFQEKEEAKDFGRKKNFQGVGGGE